MEDLWPKKVKLPDFMGTDPVRWIARAERFFEEHEIHPSDKLQWAFMSMEGVAMFWFQNWCQEDLDADWESFSQAMMRRFNYGSRTFDVLATLEQNNRREKDSPITFIEQLMEKKQRMVMEDKGSNHQIMDEMTERDEKLRSGDWTGSWSLRIPASRCAATAETSRAMEQASRCNFAASEKNIDVNDRISKLPDVILSHIVTFLNMKETVGTRLLSHRWRYIYVPMSNIELDSTFILGFDYKQLPFDGEYVSRLSHVKWKFVERVDKFLNIVMVQNPQTLKVSFPLGREFASHIDDWINFAVRMECQQVELEFDHATCDFYGNYSEPYNFPCHLLLLCEKSLLKHLFLKDCIFKPPPELANILNCLKPLRLDSDLEIILSLCLNLEWLGLIDCWLLSTLHNCGQNLKLKWLILNFCSVVEKIELSVPNLEMFEYEGWLPNFTFSRIHQLKKVVLLIHEMTQRGWKQMSDELAGNVPYLNGFFMRLEIVEDTTLDILDASNEFALVLAQAVNAEVVAPLKLAEINSTWPPKCSRSEVVRVARSLVADSSSSQQWDPGGKTTIAQGEFWGNSVVGHKAFSLLGFVL